MSKALKELCRTATEKFGKVPEQCGFGIGIIRV